jgi:hypothetical protein
MGDEVFAARILSLWRGGEEQYSQSVNQGLISRDP